MKRGSLSRPWRQYAFGPYVLDERARLLTKDGSLLAVPPKAVETLIALVERAGEVVAREELIERVWPDAFVEPNNLAQQVSILREALSDRADHPTYIETLPRRGYRFLVAVTLRTEEGEPGAAPVAAVPPVHYARSGSVNIAYQVLGEGPLDIVFVMGWVSHLEEFWTEPSFARLLHRLAGFSRLIMFDKRGTGLSDRVAELPTLEQRMDDVRAVMDAVGSSRAALLGISEGGPMCSLFAATYPQRTVALIMIGSYARRLWAPDYPWGPHEEERQEFYRQIQHDWGGPLGIEERAPSRASDPAFREWWAHYLRQGASPGAALALTRMNADVDIRDVLPLIRVPTLVLHRTGDRRLRVEEGRYLASGIPGARFVELPGSDHLPFVGDQESLLAEIETFLGDSGTAAGEESALATVLALHGPVAQPEDVASIVSSIAGLHRGQVCTDSDRVSTVTFDGPARAIRAGLTILSALAASGNAVRGGLHTGECLRRESRVEGVAVEIAHTIARRAVPGELLISRTVKDLVAGAAFEFADRGSHSVRHDGAEWRLYGVATAAQGTAGRVVEQR